MFNFYSVLALNEIHKKLLLFIIISEVISDEVCIFGRFSILFVYFNNFVCCI